MSPQSTHEVELAWRLLRIPGVSHLVCAKKRRIESVISTIDRQQALTNRAVPL